MAAGNTSHTAWRIRNNAEVLGVDFAGQTARRQGVPFDTFYFVMFGRYPTR